MGHNEPSPMYGKGSSVEPSMMTKSSSRPGGEIPTQEVPLTLVYGEGKVASLDSIAIVSISSKIEYNMRFIAGYHKRA